MCEREKVCERARAHERKRLVKDSAQKAGGERERVTERGREAIVSHQVRSKVCIFDAELGLSILARRRALETVTMTTRHSTPALTCRQRTTASTWSPANMRRAAADPLGLFLIMQRRESLPYSSGCRKSHHSNQYLADFHYFISHCSWPVWDGKIEYRESVEGKCRS